MKKLKTDIGVIGADMGPRHNKNVLSIMITKQLAFLLLYTQCVVFTT